MKLWSPQRRGHTWRSACRTHVGHIRRINEDACRGRDERGLWVVADGMGGHAAGDVASERIVTSLMVLEPRGNLNRLVNEVEASLREANRYLLDYGAQRGQVTGSTVVVLQIVEGRYACSWVGDSRIYRARAGGLEQLTRDHSLVEEMVRRGSLERAAAEQHPDAHVITRAVGAEATLSVDVTYGEVQAGDRFLLCSDGLPREVSDEEMAIHLSAEVDPEIIGDRLLALALERGAHDNVSLCVVCVDGA